MDSQEKLSELFRKAKEQEPKTSFNQTKEQFLESLTKKEISVSKSSQSFNIKKWVIMLSSIIAIVGLGFVLNNYKPTNKVEYRQESSISNNEKSQIRRTVKSTEINSISIVEFNQVPRNNELIEKPVKNFQKGKDVLPSLIFQRIQENNFQLIPDDDTLAKQNFKFPELTEKEIKRNNKIKLELLKEITRMDKSKYALIPSGSFNYKGENSSIQAFYMRNTEVTNVEYRTFLNDLLIQGKKEQYLIAKPNEKLWELYGKGCEPMSTYYFTHSAYDNFPVVTISQEGAEMYCQWLDEEIRKIKINKNRKEKIRFAKMRIPLRVEWEYAATAGGENPIYPWGNDSTRNQKGEYLCNYQPSPNSYGADGGLITMPVKSYFPSIWGLYNMCGNVAEMVKNTIWDRKEGEIINSGIGTAGGGWSETAEEIKISAKDKYEGLKEGRPNVGFRFVFTYLNR